MAFGIDTFRSRLDLIDYRDFRIWNGARIVQDVLVGGTPLFAGRKFLGGDFIWGHAEATNASSEPDGARFLCRRRSDGSRNATHMMPNAARSSQSTRQPPARRPPVRTQHLGWNSTVAATYGVGKHIDVISTSLALRCSYRPTGLQATPYPMRGWTTWIIDG